MSSIGMAPMPDLSPKKIMDKLYLGIFVVGFLGGLWIGLRGPGSLLGLNCQTLMICTIVSTALAANWLRRRDYSTDRACMYASLALIPIGLRTAFNLTLMTYASFLSLGMEDLLAFVEVVCIFSLVAVAEESFRAAMFNIAETVEPIRDKLPEWARWGIANALWCVYHFAQRQFSPDLLTISYTAWLLITGAIMCYIMREAGLGAATLAHLIVNLTA